MSKMVWIGLAVTIFTLCFAYSIDATILSASLVDNRDSVKQSSEAAIQKAVNKGSLRVNEAIEIDPVIAKQEYEKFYKENEDFNYVGSSRNIKVVKLNTSPAMLAVEGEVINKSTFKMASAGESKDVRLQFKNVVIYEAKSAIKIPGGNID